MAGSRNTTTVTVFIFLGFSDCPQIQIVLFLVFLGIYLMTLAWNLGLITLIQMDSHLHTPMYFFLSNLALVDICYSSSTTPKMLADTMAEQKTISFLGCAVQYFIFCGMGLTECFLLAAMAYDRYAAVCNPLLYTVIMSHTLCIKLAGGAFMGGFFSSLIETYSVYNHRFCGPNIINHFFCDLPPVLALSCSDTFTSQIVTFLVGVIVGVMSVLMVLVSYIYIVVAILKISSTKGRSKAFSTCASHLTAVTLFYGSGLFMYMRPRSSYALGRDKMVSVFYAVVIPMVNPMIYSLRNKEIKNAVKKVIERECVISHHRTYFSSSVGASI